MSSQVEISNAAIISIGADVISSLNEQTPEAITINAIWDQTRKALLRANAWNFAVKRVELAQSATPPNYDYDYRFALPSDNIRVLQIWSDDDYRIENGYIITNSKTCFLKYIADIKDVNQWTSDFVDVMSARLAAEIAYSITKDRLVSQQQWSIYNTKIQSALWIDATEDFQDNFQFESELLSSRYE